MLVTTEKLDEAIFEKYIRPIQRPRTGRAGVEFELPIVHLARRPTDFAVVHALTDAFLQSFGFREQGRDDDGRIYCAADPVTGDTLSYDCSYNTLELSFGAEEDLNAVYDRFVSYYTFIQDFLRPLRHSLTGMGLNPNRDINRRVPIANGRYRMLLHHLRSYTKYGDAIDFHDEPDFGLFCCASQVQLDAEEETVVEALNTFSRLEPLKALLFANSPCGPYLCSRDHFWKHSLHGLNPRNVDGYDRPLSSVGELTAYIRSMSLYCLERDGRYMNFRPTPLEEYFSAEAVSGEYYDGGRYRQVSFAPALADLAFLRSFKFEDLTYRGTIEFRSVCQQPVREIMGPAAFHTGLMERLHELTALLEGDRTVYGHGLGPSELRELFVRRELPAFLERSAASALLQRVLELAQKGLRERGHGEERFLEPLYRRANALESPAREMENGLEAGRTLEYYIEDYASLL